MADLSMVFDLLARDRASSEVNKVGDSMDRAGKKAGGFGSMVGSAMKGAAVAVGAVVAGGAYLGAGFVSDAAESAKISRLTEAAIKATGGAANVTADQVGELATALSNKAGMDDEAIQSATNLLLSFTNVRNEAGKGNDIFNQTAALAVDMSAALGKDASGSAKLLGKALNDPIKGMSALGKVGVAFTDDQKEQIKTLVESGKTLEAQQIILGEVGKRFGGAGEAAADPMARLGVIAGNLGEKVGGALLPYAEQFSSWLADKGLPFVERLIDQFQTYLPPAIDFVAAAFTTARDVLMNNVVPALEAVFGFLSEHRTTVMVVGGLIAGFLAAAFVVWGTRAAIAAAQNVVAWFRALGAARTSAAGQQLSAMQTVARWVWMGIQAVARAAWIATVWTVQTTIAAGRLVLGWTIAGAQVLARWALMGAQALFQAGRVAAVWTLQTLLTTGRLLLQWGIATAAVIGGWVLMGVQSLLQAARMAAAWLIAMGPVGWIIAAVVGLVALIIANWTKVKTWTVNAFRAVVTFVVNAWNKISSGVSSGITTVIEFVKGLPGKILSALGDFGELLLELGGDLLSGLWDGISGAIDWLKGKLGEFFGDLLPGWVKDMLGISSPSKVFAAFGRDSMRGFAAGIDDGTSGAIAAAERATAAVASVGAGLDMTGAGSSSLGFATPTYDMTGTTGGAAAGSSRTVLVSGVASPETVAAIVRREQVVDEFLAGG